jgi:hypothetical protein
MQSQEELNIPQDAEPEYLLAAGQDYLAGFDAPVDHVKGLALIRSAAEAGNPEAMEELASLCRLGIVEDPQAQQELYWAKKIATWSEQEYFSEYHQELGWRSIRHLRALTEACLAAADLPAAEAACRRWVKVAEDMYQRYCTYIPLAGARIRLGDILCLTGWPSAAEEEYQQVTQMLQEYDSVPALMGIRACLQKKTQSCRWYHVDIPMEIWDQLSDVTQRLEQMERYPGMERYFWEAPLWEAALPLRCGLPKSEEIYRREDDLYLQSLKAMEAYVSAQGSAALQEQLAQRLMEYCAMAWRAVSPKAALWAAKKAYEIWEKRYNTRHNAVYQVLMAICMEWMGTCSIVQCTTQEADQLFLKAYGLLSKTGDPALKQRAVRHLVANYGHLADCCREYSLTDAAGYYEKKAAVMEKKLDK